MHNINNERNMSVKIVGKIEEIESLMTPVKQVVFKIKAPSDDSDRSFIEKLVEKEGILLATLNNERTNCKVIFDTSKFEEGQICEFITA